MPGFVDLFGDSLVYRDPWFSYLSKLGSWTICCFGGVRIFSPMKMNI